MDKNSLFDRFREADQYVLPLAIAVVAALAPVASRATVPALFLIFVFQIVWQIRNRAMPLLDWPIMAGVLALTAWSYLSTAWALAPTYGAATQLLFLVIGGFSILAWAERPSGGRGLRSDYVFVGLAVAVSIYVFEWISWAWLTRLLHRFEWRDILDLDTGGIAVKALLINGTAILALLAWPGLTILIRRKQRLGALALIGSVLACVIVFGNELGAIGLVAGFLIWGAVSWGSGKFVRALAVMFVCIVLVTPFVCSRVLTQEAIDRIVLEVPATPNSALARLMIWKFTSERIAERPVLGWGFDAARRIPGGGDKFELRDAHGNVRTSDLNLPLHPHNQVLQVWLELGAVGALIVALTGAAIFWRIARLPDIARNGSTALACAIIVFQVLSYGAWQSWWIAANILAIAAQVAVNSSIKSE